MRYVEGNPFIRERDNLILMNLVMKEIFFVHNTSRDVNVSLQLHFINFVIIISLHVSCAF